MSFIEKVKKRWGVESNGRLIKIVILFAVTGSSTVWVRKPIFAYLNFNTETVSPLIFWPVRILSIFILYQFLFLAWGWLFREYKFAKWFVGKMTKRFRRK